MPIIALFALVNIVVIITQRAKIKRLQQDATYEQTQPTRFGKLFLLSLRNPLFILLHLVAFFFSVLFLYPLYLYAFYLWRVASGYLPSETVQAKTIAQAEKAHHKEQQKIEAQALAELRIEEKHKIKEELREQVRLEQAVKIQEKEALKQQVFTRLKEQTKEIINLFLPQQKAPPSTIELSAEEVAMVKRFYNKLLREFIAHNPNRYPIGMENFPHEPLIFERIMPVHLIPLKNAHQPLVLLVKKVLTMFPSIAYGYVGETKEHENGLFWVGIGHAPREIIVIASSSLTAPRYKIYSFNVISLSFTGRPALLRRLKFSLRKYIDDILIAVALTSPNHGLAPHE